MSGLTHIGDDGAARMVDVGAKAETVRRAVAKGRIDLNPVALDAVRHGSGPKGEVLATARIAGIMAAKRTAELIPLCHPLPIDAVDLSFEADERGIIASADVRSTGRTGIEMEAMTAVSVALLTIYDMIKAVQRDARIGDIRLSFKDGGKSGLWQAD
jgi:cyclic pyranopterin monophosphate synthase